MVLGAVVGAGFAAFESAGYALQTMLDNIGDHTVRSILQTEASRALLAPFGHITWTALLGGAIFASWQGGRLHVTARLVWTAAGVILLHALWDQTYGTSITLAEGVTGAGWHVVWPNAQTWYGSPSAAARVWFNVFYDLLLALNAAVGVTWIVHAWRGYGRPSPAVPQPDDGARRGLVAGRLGGGRAQQGQRRAEVRLEHRQRARLVPRRRRPGRARGARRGSAGCGRRRARSPRGPCGSGGRAASRSSARRIALPAAATKIRWKPRSASTNAGSRPRAARSSWRAIARSSRARSSVARRMTFAIAWRSTSRRVSMTLSTSSAETGTTSAPRFGYSRSRPSDSRRRKASRTGVRLSRTPAATSPSLMSVAAREAAVEDPLASSRRTRARSPSSCIYIASLTAASTAGIHALMCPPPRRPGTRARGRLLRALRDLGLGERLLTTPAALRRVRVRRAHRVPPAARRGRAGRDAATRSSRSSACATARACRSSRAAAAPSLSGGSLPVEGGIVIALNRLNRVLRIDPDARTAVVRARRHQPRRQPRPPRRTAWPTRPTRRASRSARSAATSPSTPAARTASSTG